MDVAELRSAAKRIRDREKPDLEAAKRLLDAAHGQPELVVASLVFMRHRTKLKKADWPDVARWAQGIESPEAADLFAQYVARPLYDRAKDKKAVDRWAESAEPMLRRLALRVAGMAVADELARDEDPKVQEALVEVLRAADEGDLYKFLKRHEKMPTGVMRAAAASLDPGHALELTMARKAHRARER